MKKLIFPMKWLIVALLLCGACSSKGTEQSQTENVETKLETTPNEVKVMTLKRKGFELQLVSNGKVSPTEFADLTFGTEEVVSKVYVKNGDRVVKGQKLAELDCFKLKNSLEQAKTALEQAELDLKDVLIGQGYSPSEMKKVPADVMKLAGLKSGYEQSKARYELAKYDLEHAVLVAPFSGVVANLFDKEHNVPSVGKPFCRIINNGTMEVDFNVLESELPLLKNGDRVTVTSYAAADKVFHGKIVSINPMVDELAMVRVKARIEGSPSSLFDGMNVKVSVFRSVNNALVVPKTAVVLRSGKQVVFTLKKGKAYWNYVHTALENKDEYALTEDGEDVLSEGDTVIVDGNLNLAHETPVTVVNKQD